MLLGRSLTFGETIPIINPSFEADTIAGANAPVYQALSTAPQGWTYSSYGSAGLLAPDAGEPNPFYNGPTPGYDGTNVAYLYSTDGIGNPTMTQTLATTLQPDTTYHLSLQIGYRTSNTAWGGYHVVLKTTSGAIVGEWTGANQPFTTAGNFGTTSRSFTTGDQPPGLGEPLQIVIQQAGGIANSYLDFDNVVLTTQPAPARPVNTPIDVFIVAGQSNSMGWEADVDQLNADNQHYAYAPNPNAFMAYKINLVGQALYNVGSFSQLTYQGAGFSGPYNGFGPELSLVGDLADRSTNKVAVVKFSSAGAGLDNNFKKSANQLYPLLIQEIRDALAQMRSQGFAPTLRGFFWLQGETDAMGTGTDATDSVNYGANITQLVSDVRTDLGAPNLRFVLTEINRNMPAFAPYQAQVQLVNQGMMNLANNDANVQFVTLADINTGFSDGSLHYNANQNIEIGLRWANAYLPRPAVYPVSVFKRVPEAASQGFKILYSLDLPLNGGFAGTIPVPYSVDNSATLVGPFSRVAYYLELIKADGTAQWVYVSMDPFTQVAKELGLPHSTLNPALFQQYVSNLNVFTNVPGVVTGTSLSGGSLEIWPSNYTPGNANGIPGASDATFDFGDGGGSAAVAGYGSFQIHNTAAQQTVLAYNRWGVGDFSNDDVGIGNQPGGNPDWTGAGNTADYVSRKLVVLVRPVTLP